VKRILILAAVFVIAFSVRFASLDTLTGDDHYTLWKAASFLKGDRPFRDFVDLGDPLYWGMTTAAQAVSGYRVVGEVVLGMALEALAFTIAFSLAWRATGSLAAAAVLTALALLVARRELYSYPKIFLYPLGLWFCWRYIDRPTLLRAVALALGVAVAFGYRHDHGAYVGAGAAAACLAAHWPEGPRRIVMAWLRVGAVVLLFLAPYLALMQAHEGIVNYFQERIRLARVIDATSRRPVRFTVDASAPEHWLRIDPPPPARVIVEWQPNLTSEAQSTLESKYSLTHRQEYSRDNDRTRWQYALTDVSTGNLRAIVQEPRIFDTGLIERERLRPMEESAFIRAQRAVPLLRMNVAPRYWHEENAGVFLHYVSLALPSIALIILVGDRMRGRRGGRMPNAPEKTFATAVMMAVVCMALLRRTGYFAEHLVATTVLAACVLGYASSLSSRAIAGTVLIAAILAGGTYVHLFDALARMHRGVGGVWTDSVAAFNAYSTSPPIDAYAPRGTTGDRGLIRYVYECTRPDDRVWILSDLFAFPYYTERRVVRHIYWQAGLLTSPEEQRKTIEQVDGQQVPIVLGLGGQGPLGNLNAYPLVRDYVEKRYTGRYSIPEERLSGAQFWLLTDSRRQPTGTYEPLGLPCFR